MDCLITKLKAVANNNNLPIFDSLTVNVIEKTTLSETSNIFTIESKANITLEIYGDGYFVDSDYESNPRKSLNIQANVETQVYFTVGVYSILVPKVSQLVKFGIYGSGASQTDKNYKIDLSELYGTENLTWIMLSGTDSTGDISSLVDNLTIVGFGMNLTPITGNINKFIEAQIEAGRTHSIGGPDGRLNSNISINGTTTNGRFYAQIISPTNYKCYIGRSSTEYTSYTEYNLINGEWVASEPVTP